MEIRYWFRLVEVLSELVSSYDRMSKAMSLGMDLRVRLWGARLASKLAPRVVADVGCGLGSSTRILRLVMPYTYIVALDPSARLLAVMGSSVLVERVVAVAEHLPLRDCSVDAVLTFFASRDFISLARSLLEMCRSSRTLVVLVDVFNPDSLVFRVVSRLWFCGVVPLVALALAGGEWRGYSHLCRTLFGFPSPSKLAQMVGVVCGKAYYSAVARGVAGVVLGVKKRSCSCNGGERCSLWC